MPSLQRVTRSERTGVKIKYRGEQVVLGSLSEGGLSREIVGELPVKGRSETGIRKSEYKGPEAGRCG